MSHLSRQGYHWCGPWGVGSWFGVSETAGLGLSPRTAICNKLPGDASAAGPRTTVCKPALWETGGGTLILQTWKLSEIPE